MGLRPFVFLLALGMASGQSYAQKPNPSKVSKKHVKKATKAVKSKTHKRVKPRRRLAESQVTGLLTVSRAMTMPTANSVTGRPRSIVLDTRVNQAAPSFVGELNSVLMSQDIMNQVDGKMRERVGALRIDNGFYTQSFSNAVFIESQKDRRGGYYNQGLTAQQDLLFRKDMAGMMKGFMLSKGIRNFLKSREETKNVGRVYDEAMDLTHTSFQSTTPSGVVWKYSTGVDPFYRPNMVRSWFSADSDKWSFVNENFVNKKMVMAGQVGLSTVEPVLRVSRRTQSNILGTIQTQSSVSPLRSSFYQSISHPFNTTTSGALECTIPYGAEDFARQIFTKVSMSHAF